MGRTRDYVIGDDREFAIAALTRDLKKLRRGKRYKITVETIRSDVPASREQKALWWIWMGIIGDDIGDTKEGVYEDFFKDSAILAGRGISQLSMDEMSDLMTWTQQYFSEWGYYLPSGHDEYYEALEGMLTARGKLT